MVVLDEHLGGRLKNSIKNWYRGSVIAITELRPNTIIKDEIIPQLLSRKQYPCFITMNVTDFWEKVLINHKFCVVCFSVPDRKKAIISTLLKSLFQMPDFRAKRQRGGYVFRIDQNGGGLFYKYNEQQRKSLDL